MLLDQDLAGISSSIQYDDTEEKYKFFKSLRKQDGDDDCFSPQRPSPEGSDRTGNTVILNVALVNEIWPISSLSTILNYAL